MNAGETLPPDHQITSADASYRFIYQWDGNLVLYEDSTPLWASGTAGSSPSVCIMQDDGDLVIYSGEATQIWASGTAGSGGSYLIV